MERLQEQGSHDELLKQKGQYYHLYTSVNALDQMEN